MREGRSDVEHPSDICSLIGISSRLQLEQLLRNTDYQQHILGLGNIWETFESCTAHSASCANRLNSFLNYCPFFFLRVNTDRITCHLAYSANFACKINE